MRSSLAKRQAASASIFSTKATVSHFQTAPCSTPLQGVTTHTGVRATTAGVYSFYEVYKDEAAAAHHKTLPHYKGWADFKAANMETVGASQTVVKFTSIVGDD